MVKKFLSANIEDLSGKIKPFVEVNQKKEI